MACITKGHTIACSDRNRRGGIKRIWLSEIDNVGMGDFAVDSSTGAIAPDAVGETMAAVLTMPGNFTVATDFKANPVDMWYNRDEKENRFRMTYSFGCAIKEPSMFVVSRETA